MYIVLGKILALNLTCAKNIVYMLRISCMRCRLLVKFKFNATEKGDSVNIWASLRPIKKIGAESLASDCMEVITVQVNQTRYSVYKI